MSAKTAVCVWVEADFAGVAIVQNGLDAKSREVKSGRYTPRAARAPCLHPTLFETMACGRRDRLQL
jgi:hypothetical protein